MLRGRMFGVISACLGAVSGTIMMQRRHTYCGSASHTNPRCRRAPLRLTEDAQNLMRIICDVDSVVADILPRWLALYNAAVPEDARRSLADCTVWDMRRVVPPQYGALCMSLLRHEHFYARVQPVARARDGVQALRAAGHEVVFATTCVWGTVDQKAAWLEGHGLVAPTRSGHGLPRGLIVTAEKAGLRGDVLIDDGPHNLRPWLATDRPAIVFDHAYNRDMNVPAIHASRLYRAAGWPAVLALVAALNGGAAAARPRGAAV